MCCKLWEYCLGVIPLLIQPAKLVQYIECGDDDYFIWVFRFFFAYMSLPFSLIFCLLVQVACSMLPEELSLFGLLKESAFLSFLLGFSSMCWVRIDVWLGPSASSNWSHGLYSVFKSYPSYKSNNRIPLFGFHHVAYQNIFKFICLENLKSRVRYVKVLI